VLDNAGHTRRSGVRTGAVAPPAIELEAPTHGGRVRGEVEVRAVATPDHPTYWVTFSRQVGDGARTPIGTDTSSPVYTAFDDTTGLADGSTVRYKAVLTYAPGQVVESATRGVTVVTEPVTTAVVQDRRPAGDDDQWGLHLWGDAIADGVATSWNGPDSGTTSTLRRRLPDPAQGRHQAGQLHHAPARRRCCSGASVVARCRNDPLWRRRRAVVARRRDLSGLCPQLRRLQRRRHR